MKQVFIIANWKSFKTTKEAQDWCRELSPVILQTQQKEKVVIICPSFTLLPIVSASLKNHARPFFVGAQNISPFEEGAYTGEINAKQVKEFGDYTILGHSERRKYFRETEKVLMQKVQLAMQYNINPIYCVPDRKAVIPQQVFLVAYEPVTAIGSGNPDTPDNANETARYIKEKNPQVRIVLYGGSVTQDNVANFTNKEAIDGVLVGGASLNPLKFSQIINNA
jgi:triosephosphate isomerase